MDNKNTDDILTRAKKLAAKAADEKKVGNEEYAQNVAAMLQKLLVKHRLSMMDVESHDAEVKEDPIEKNYVNWSEHGWDRKRKRKEWLERLGSIVAKAHGCIMLVITGSDTLVLVGPTSNTQVAEYVLAMLRRAAETLSLAEYDKYWAECDAEGRREDAKGYKGAWLTGFANRLEHRFEEEMRGPESSERGLMVINQDLARTKDHMSKMRVGQAAGLNRAKFNAAGRRDGESAANNMNLKSNAVKGKKQNNRQIGS